MRMTVLLASAGAVTLAGCSAEPIELPKDAMAAARTCFVAAGLTGRQGKAESDPVTYEEFIAAIAYPMAAASLADPFTVESVAKVMDGAKELGDELASKDYAAAVPACDKRFGIDKTVELAKDDADALLSCVTMTGFMQGAVSSAGGDFGDRAKQITAQFTHLQSKMQSDPKVLVKLIGGDAEKAMLEATKRAFAEGAPDAYLKACDARFPA